MNSIHFISVVVCLLASASWCAADSYATSDEPYLIILGIAQDAGYPQAGCQRDCCRPAWNDSQRRRFASCVAVVDPQSQQRWLFDCTPDFRDQLHHLLKISPAPSKPQLNGIFLTHGHVGHYAGLIHLGREVMGAKQVPVFAMPRMKRYLETNGPWNLLVRENNIELVPLAADRTVKLNDRIAVTPILVPHRGEFSETVAFKIQGPKNSVLYLPDIDKWDLWERRIEDEIEQVDVALLDATFFDDGEVPGRDMTTIPHPFIVESIRKFSALEGAQRGKVRFIHLNHTNPALDPQSEAVQIIERAGMNVAAQMDVIEL